ncbi:MAG: GrpB family protein [Myxococcota bacterium]
MEDVLQLRVVDTGPEARRVLGLIEGVLPGVDACEVGSTAVPGVIGKGDLDLVVRVPADTFAAARASLDALFPRNPEQLSNQQYQGYVVPSDHDVAIQLTVLDGPYDTFHSFLDALRADAGLVSSYNDLKRAYVGRPMAEYRAAKAAFVEQVVRAVELPQ